MLLVKYGWMVVIIDVCVLVLVLYNVYNCKVNCYEIFIFYSKYYVVNVKDYVLKNFIYMLKLLSFFMVDVFSILIYFLIVVRR